MAGPSLATEPGQAIWEMSAKMTLTVSPITAWVSMMKLIQVSSANSALGSSDPPLPLLGRILVGWLSRIVIRSPP